VHTNRREYRETNKQRAMESKVLGKHLAFEREVTNEFENQDVHFAWQQKIKSDILRDIRNHAVRRRKTNTRRINAHLAKKSKLASQSKVVASADTIFVFFHHHYH